jgi:hypothetical protein
LERRTPKLVGFGERQLTNYLSLKAAFSITSGSLFTSTFIDTAIQNLAEQFLDMGNSV